MVIIMTILDPNKHYIYERVGGKIYARECGNLTRILLGHDITSDEYLEEWKEIFLFARANSILQEELNRVKLFYYLLKEDTDKIPHHPV